MHEYATERVYASVYRAERHRSSKLQFQALVPESKWIWQWFKTLHHHHDIRYNYVQGTDYGITTD